MDFTFHKESNYWWAESDELPGWSVTGDTIEIVQLLIRHGISKIIGVPMEMIVVGERTYLNEEEHK